MTSPDWRGWLFSAKAFLASMIALFVALSLDLPRPYWAMAAVYVVANPLAGATSSKGLYRALGTLLGASAAVLIVPVFVNSPELLTIIIALWTGTLLLISMLDRSARSYVFMLAGYTLPMIALPSVGSPEAVFDTALARSEEIIIGIVCASIVSAVVFPVSVRSTLSDRVRSWLDDAGSWADEILRGEGAAPATPLKRQKLASDVTALDMIISQLGHDPHGRDIVRHSRELRGRLLMLLPLFSSLADRLHGLKSGTGKIPEELSSVLNDVADWLVRGGRGGTDRPAEQLRHTINVLESGNVEVDWNSLLYRSAVARLGEIVDLWHDCLTLRDQIRDERGSSPWLPAFRHRQVVGRNRHYDMAMIAFSSLSVIAAMIVASGFWILSGWQSGGGLVVMAAVACSFFAAMDTPAPFIRTMFVWAGVSLVISFAYIFGILPAVNSFELLVVVFAPPFLLLGLLITKPKFNMLGMLLAVNTASFVALQDHYTADFTTFVNEGVGSLAGIGFALAWTLITRPFGAELAASRLIRSGWKDLAGVAAGKRQSDFKRLSGRTLDRLGQIVPRLATIENRELKAVDGFAEVRLGFNILILQSRVDALCNASSSSVRNILARIAAHYETRMATGRAVEPENGLREAIDEGLRTILREEPHRASEVIDALVGLRRSLFPQAPPPEDLPKPPIQTAHFRIAAE